MTILERAIHKKRIGKELTEEEYLAIEAKWKARKDGYVKAPPVILNIDWSDIAVPERDPLKHYCSFCGVEVDQTRLTKGSGHPRAMIKEELKIIHGVPTIEEKIIHVTEKLEACPDCSLHVPKADIPNSD